MEIKTIKLLFFFFLFSSASAQLTPDPAAHVNPFIGTGGHGHTFPGATVPFGMVQLSPDTRIDGSWDGCSGYHYSDSVIYGFSHTHLSGTGVSDYGDVAFLPLNNTDCEKYYKRKYTFSPFDVLITNNAFEKFSHRNEKTEAGYYSVTLNNQVKSELTTTTRCGFHKYAWPEQAPRILIIKLNHRDKTTLSSIRISNDKKKILVSRESEAWAKDQWIFFSFEFSEEFEIVTRLAGSEKQEDGYTMAFHVPYIILKFK
ncbi:MAG: hypothetical protein ACHQF2_10415, partial [Flavobacteriales bacterium]